MKRISGKESDFKYIDYIFDESTIRYIVMNKTKNVFMFMFPNGYGEKLYNQYQTIKDVTDGFPDHHDWYCGALVHLHLSHHSTPKYENSYKLSESTVRLQFTKQTVASGSDCDVIKTYAAAPEGYSVCHTLKHYKGENGFEVSATFSNDTGKAVVLEMISSASIDNLTPFAPYESPEGMVYHTFRGGWSTEGKLVSRKLSEINMEKSWGGSFECEKIGGIGSRTVGRYFPYSALEDVKYNCTWGIKLKHNATWQIELSRYGEKLSLSAGLGDYTFGGWRKRIPTGGQFETPTAYVAVVEGGIAKLSNDLNKMNDRDINAYGEEGMPIIFNDWVTHFGATSAENLIRLAKSLQGSQVKYFVVDSGWQINGIGDWIVNRETFPDGLKAYTDEIRALGYVPGIWLEFESIRDEAERYSEQYDHLNLTKDGFVIKNDHIKGKYGTGCKFLDFRKKEVHEFLQTRVIDLLKDNGFGYLKIDYNINIGIGCDDEDSLGEGLRQHMQQVYEFVKLLKQEIPDLIIENCSSGGCRLDPKMMGITAMSSFSDAHECKEIPIIAANLHYVISPRQSQVWCTLKPNFSEDHFKYVISSGFLGRLCWSGYIDKLNEDQLQMMLDAEAMYQETSHIIKDGRSVIYRTDAVHHRYPTGTQVVVRTTPDESEMLVVCHFFEDAKPYELNIGEEYSIEKSLYPGHFKLQDGTLQFESTMLTANVLYLKKR